MRNERYLPALTTPVMRYVPEPLTGVGGLILTYAGCFSDPLQTTQNTAVGLSASGQADDTFCAPMHVNKVLS